MRKCAKPKQTMQKSDRILVTGGAGFIGSWLVDELIKKGYAVRILDNLEPQTHGGKIPSYLNKKAEFIKGDIRNLSTFKKALEDINIVFHLASSVGIGQSNYQIRKYTQTNVLGTANLAQILINQKTKVKKVIFPASMTGLGEGYYFCSVHKKVRPQIRSKTQLAKGDWELHCPICKKIVKPIPTDEKAEEHPESIYAITKRASQNILLTIGQMYEIPTIALRLFNVYGPRQSLSNPYTGVTAIFTSRLKNNEPIVIYEDGKQTRDFVSVHDVVDAFLKASVSTKANYELINIGSGKPTTIKKVAQVLSNSLDIKGKIEIPGNFRVNDVRNCYADIKLAKKYLNWKPKTTFQKGIEELVNWSKNEKATDTFEKSIKILKKRGLSN